MNKLTEYIHDNFSYDINTLRLIDAIIDYFEYNDDKIDIIYDILSSIDDISYDTILENI